MKSCFAKCNFGRVEFSGKKEIQFRLDETRELKSDNCKKFILSHYEKGGIKTFQEICVENICREFNYFLHSDFNNCIKELEKEGKIKVERDPFLTPTGKERKALLPDDKITFV